MNIKLRDILLKSIPYLLSVAGGIILFVVTVDNVKNANVADLINNIAASLLSIPIVFLLYDYSNYRISRQLNKTMATSMSDRVTGLMLSLTIILRKTLGLRGQITLDSINKMQTMRKSEIEKRLHISDAQMTELHAAHDKLDDLIYKYNSILSGGEVSMLSGLARDVLRLINGYKFGANRATVAKYASQIIDGISDWLDSDAASAMHFQQLLAESMAAMKK